MVGTIVIIILSTIINKYLLKRNYPKKWFVVSEYFNPIMESVKTNQIFAKPYIDILTGKYIKKSKIPSVKLKIDPITGRSHWFIT